MADSAATIAQTAAAPADERHDAQIDMIKSHGIQGLASDLMPSSELQPVIDHIQEMFAEQDMAKAAQGNLIKGPWAAPKPKIEAGQSVFTDQFQIQMHGGYWDRPGLLGFDQMRSMVEQTPILNSILLTRIRQFNRFCRPQTDLTDVGFRIQHVDPNAELDAEQQQSVALIQRFISNCGWEDDPRTRKRLRRDSFAQFIAKSVRDTLTFDAAPIETVFKRDKRLGLAGFHAVDGASIRLCSEMGYEGDDEIQAVQVVEGTVRTAYTFDDLVYEVRNPRTDIRACGYGYGEPEMLIRVVTYLLNAMTYNGAFFDKNAIPRGFLSIYGNYEQKDLGAFRRYWNSMVRGVDNSHNMPIMVSKDQESGADWTEIGGQMDEMAFAKWLTFLTAISCAIYGTAPEEISMESFAASKSSLSGSDTGEKLVSANDKGFRPLLGFYENTLNDFVINTFSPNYRLQFVGLDVEDGKQRFERAKLGQTWNEFRSQDGLDAIEGPLGDMPMNQAFIQVWSMENDVGQPEQPTEPGEDFGDPDAADGDGFGGAAGGDPAGGDPAEGDAQDGDAPGEDQPKPGDDAPADDGFGDEMSKALNPEDFGFPVLKIEG
jgi:hypothetical protein